MIPNFRGSAVRALAIGCAAVLAAVLTGCGSGSATGSAYPDAAEFDSNLPESGAPMDGGITDVPKSPPMSGEDNFLLFKGEASLIRNGPACTSAVSATADRWCAFTSQSTVNLDEVDLYVINVSRAVAGVTVTCGGGTVDPNCLKLTGGFFEESVKPFPHAAGFQGDTLTYFDLTATAYGWRPGMSNGRVLIANDAGTIHDCVASAKGTGVLCLKDPVTQPVAGITQADLYAGKLDAATDPPLTKVDTVITNDASLTAAQQKFRVGFRPDGEFVAWSSAPSSGGVEILKTQQLGDDSTRRTVALDVSRWNVSPDGTRWYWLSQFNYNITGMRSGILQSADFAGNGAPTTLLPSVGEFTVTRSGSIVARAMVSSSRGDLKSIPDPIGAPTAVVTLDTGVGAFLSIGSQGHVAYAKSADPVFTQLVDLYIKKLDGTGTLCPLTNKAIGLSTLFFLPGGGAVVWGSVTNLDSTTDTSFNIRESFTRLSDCTTLSVANGIGSYGIAGDEAVLIEDQFDGTDGTLRIQKVNSGETLAAGPPALIQTRINDYVPLTPTPGVVLFTVAAGSNSDGLYFHVVGASQQPANTDAGRSSDAASATDGSVDGGAAEEPNGG